jgi:hypothetical protein
MTRDILTPTGPTQTRSGRFLAYRVITIPARIPCASRTPAGVSSRSPAGES